MIVRYPSGVSVTYPRANYLVRTDDAWDLYEKVGDKEFWIAAIQLSAGVTVESGTHQGIVENPAQQLTGEHAIGEVSKRLRTYRHEQISHLKRALRSYNINKRQWGS